MTQPPSPAARPDRRNKLFDSEFHDGFGQWPVAYIPVGGADMGDIVAVADEVAGGDDSAFHEAWVAAGDRKNAEAVSVLAAGHRASAAPCSCGPAASIHRPIIRCTVHRWTPG